MFWHDHRQQRDEYMEDSHYVGCLFCLLPCSVAAARLSSLTSYLLDSNKLKIGSARRVSPNFMSKKCSRTVGKVGSTAGPSAL